MAKALAVPEIPGVNNLWSLLAFLGDRDAYQARLTALQTHADTIRALLGQIEGAEDLERARLLARDDRQLAAEELARATAQAKALIGTALEDRDAAVAAAAQARQALAAERVEFEAQVTRAKEEIAAAFREITERETAAAQVRVDAQALAAQARAVTVEYEGRLARLEAGIAAARG